MKKLLFLTGIFLLASCHEERKEQKLDIYLKVEYQDNSVDTLKVPYIIDERANGVFIPKYPYLKLNDKGCLETGYESFMMRSRTNVACNVRTYESLYGVVNEKDTLR